MTLPSAFGLILIGFIALALEHRDRRHRAQAPAAA